MLDKERLDEEDKPRVFDSASDPAVACSRRSLRRVCASRNCSFATLTSIGNLSPCFCCSWVILTDPGRAALLCVRLTPFGFAPKQS